MRDYDKFFLHMYLRGFEIMGVNKKKIDRMALLRQYIKEYKDFIKQFDLKPIVEYFEVGLKANQFKDFRTNRILGKNENLWWGFNSGGYQYTLRRQPLRAQGNNVNDIMNQLLQQQNEVKK